MEKLEGTIEKILFKNEENGYAVLRIKLDYTKKKIAKYKDILYTNLLTVTSFFDRFPVIGEQLEFQGDFEESKYGIQFKAQSYSRINEDTLETVIAYLSSDYFPGIGKKIAAKIFEVIGKNCLEKIRKDKNILDKVDGLTLIQKDTIYKGLIDNKKKEKDTLDYINMGFTIQMAQRILTELTKEEIEVAKENPYLLIDKVEGIGFLKADKIALAMGISEHDPLRIKACLKFIIDRMTFETGNCYLEKDKLLITVNKYIKLDSEDYEKYLNILETDGKIYIDESNVYEYSLYESEGKLAAIIASLIIHNHESLNKEVIIDKLEKVKKELKIEYSPKQEEAIINAFIEKIMVITGGPGTGKTTIVEGIIDLYKKLYPSPNLTEEVYLLAPTGRASKRLAEVTKMPAQTIHKFLAYDGKTFHNNENNPINAKLVIIDEMSMVDVVLACKLFSALTNETRIIIVGDVDQIPSVSPGNVLEDIIKTGKIKTIKLDKIHRQAQDSSIIRLAHEVNHGIIPLDLFEKQKDRNFINIDDENIIINSLKKIIHKAIEQNMSIFKDIQVLIPMYKRPLGIDNINNILQEEFNPLNEFNNEIVFGKQKFRINDKVIQLVNRNDDNIMNGDIGIVESFIYDENKIIGMFVKFDNGLVEYTKDNYEELKLAYAISIHKSQGSEFNTTIIPFSKSYSIMLKRRLYYTAITRAKKFLIMIGNFEAFKMAVSNTDYSRNTKLKEKILEAINNYEQEIKHLKKE